MHTLSCLYLQLNDYIAVESELRTKITELESVVTDYKTQIDESKLCAKSNETIDAQISTFESLLSDKELAVNELLAKLEAAEIKHSEELLTLELEVQ